ncbi:hypothetical protein BVRB_1g012510 [Beta vulgaris subsp. vulgaris]|nr:hypothetical protein BVRB_1g012510 [Beta vulgaris subsp. vulgaris]
MGVLNISKKLRYALNPYSEAYHAISATHYSFPQSFSTMTSKSSFITCIFNGSNSTNQSVKNFLAPDTYNSYQLFSSSCINSSPKTIGNLVDSGLSTGDISSIIDVIKGDGNDMESRLDLIESIHSKSIIQVFHCLNLYKLPALRFFTWWKNAYPSFTRNSHICSLVVSNCGLLGDYANMLELLKDFRNQQICLSEKAFGFLLVSSDSMEVAKKSITEVIELLTEVGGSCRNSGIHSLLEMLCSLISFDLAKYVIDITERKVSYYNILVKHMCTRGQFKDARNLFEEMRGISCDPDTKTYNYLISSLCKQGSIDQAVSVFEEILGRGCSPNFITFETLIYFACKYGRSDHAIMLYDQMVSCGVKPRLSTHYAFIRGYFRSQQFDEAYRYVVDNASASTCSVQEIYNVLASLHLQDGYLIVAHNLLVEMLQKGLKPKHSIFWRTAKSLRETGKPKFANNLEAWYYSRDVG